MVLWQQYSTACLASLACIPSGLGFAGQPLVGRPTSATMTHDSTSAPERAANPRRTQRRRTKNASESAFASIARRPVPPGYEGQKKEQNDNRDFNLNVGRVIETLRTDYPRLLFDPLDFSIYTPDVQLRDPTGVVLSGLPAYQRMFGVLRFFRQVMVNEVSTTFRLSYDASRQQIRVAWHFTLDARAVARPLRVDGVSVYNLSGKGFVRRHDVETIIANGTPVKPPFAQAWINLPSWVSQGLAGGGEATVPGLTSQVGLGSATLPLVAGLGRGEGDFSFGHDVSSLEAGGATSSTASAGLVGSHGLSAVAGACAMAGESFEGTDGQMQGDKTDECGGAGDDTRKREEPTPKAKPAKRKKRGFWPIVDVPGGCETSWDCHGGQVCCDLIVVKVCCSNGMMQPKPGDLIPARIPVPGRGRTDIDHP